MRDFTAWLRYVLDIEKPYSDYESDTYLEHKNRRRTTIYPTFIVAGIVVMGAALILAD